MLTAYITDGHEAANFGIAFGFFALAYVLGVFVAIKRMDIQRDRYGGDWRTRAWSSAVCSSYVGLRWAPSGPLARI